MNFRTSTRCALALALTLLTIIAGVARAAEPNTVLAPHSSFLVLQITVDQLRGDMLPRYQDRFGANGFRRLMDHGLYYTNAHYGTANTFTASGHAVLVTGADTAEHGMVANEWFDRDSGKTMYSTFDAKHGMSPANLTSSTLGDELVLSAVPDIAISGLSGQSRAFAIAGKDRSAIIPAGHLGKAYWFNDKDGGFTTSTYYGAPPTWLQAWNAEKPIDTYHNKDWTPLAPQSSAPTPTSSNSHARPGTLGRTFPHKLPFPANREPTADELKAFLSAFRNTPYLDELTLKFAKDLIAAEKIGQGGTDYLSISLSGNDYIGHAFGPESREYQDSLVRLDRGLADFLAFLDKTIGHGRFLVVLSADHGVADIPENAHDAGFDADRFYPKKLLEQMNAALKARFNTTEDLIAAFATPGFYLVPDLPFASAAPRTVPSRTDIENALADELRKVPGVAYAFTRSDLLAGRIPHTPLLDKVARSFHPARSGDVIIIQKQFWYLYHDPECCASMHGSPYSYDTHVPVIFYGPGLKPRSITRTIEPASIAPTLAALLHIKPPSGNSAPVLPEVLGLP